MPGRTRSCWDLSTRTGTTTSSPPGPRPGRAALARWRHYPPVPIGQLADAYARRSDDIDTVPISPADRRSRCPNDHPGNCPGERVPRHRLVRVPFRLRVECPARRAGRSDGRRPRPDSASIFGAPLDRSAGGFGSAPVASRCRARAAPSRGRWSWRRPGTRPRAGRWSPTRWRWAVAGWASSDRYQRSPATASPRAFWCAPRSCIQGRVDALPDCLPLFGDGATQGRGGTRARITRTPWRARRPARNCT